MGIHTLNQHTLTIFVSSDDKPIMSMSMLCIFLCLSLSLSPYLCLCQHPTIAQSNAPFQVQKALAYSGMSTLVLGLVSLITFAQSRQWLDVARVRYGGTRSDQAVDEAVQVTRLLPYMALIVIFWACYAQMSTNFILQGCQMDLVVGTGCVKKGLRTLSVNPSCYMYSFIQPLLPFTPMFIHLYYHIYTYVHPLYMCIHHIYT